MMYRKPLFTIIILVVLIGVGVASWQIWFRENESKKQEETILEPYIPEKMPSDTLRLEDITFDINKVPENDALIVQKSIFDTVTFQGGQVLRFTNKKVYRSPNNKSFAIVTTFNYENADKSGSSILKIFDESGDFLFQISRSLEVKNCYLDDDKRFIHILWVDTWRDVNTLISYNFSGKEIRKINNVRTIYTNQKRNVLAYEFYANNTWTIGYIDLIKHITWEKNIKIDNPGVFLTMSNDGQNIVGWADNNLYSWTSNGRELWQKNVSYGFTNLSSNGKMLLRISRYNKMEIFDNTNGELILERSHFMVDNENFKPSMGKFIGGSHTIALSTFTGRELTKLIFIDLEGNLLDSFELKSSYKSYFSIKKSDSEFIDIYFDGLPVLRKQVDWLKN